MSHKPLSLLDSQLNDDEDIPGLVDIPRSISIGQLSLSRTCATKGKNKGVKTLMDIIKQDPPVPHHLTNLVSSIISSSSTNENTFPIPKLVRQQAIHSSIKECAELKMTSPDGIDESMAKNTIVGRKILPGWRIIDAMVDGIVVGMVVFPWPLWAAIFLVVGMRVPMIVKASSKTD